MAGIQWALAIIVLIIIVFPIYWMLVSSVKSQEEILLAIPTLWPKEFHFENYINVLNRGNFAKYYWNTSVMTAGILIAQVVTGIFAGYGFSKGKFKGQGYWRTLYAESGDSGGTGIRKDQDRDEKCRLDRIDSE